MNTNVTITNATMRQQRNYRYALSLSSDLHLGNINKDQVEVLLQIFEEMKRESEDKTTALEYTQDAVDLIDRSIEFAKVKLDIVAKDNEYRSHCADALHSDSLELIQRSIREAIELRCLIAIYNTRYISTDTVLTADINMLLDRLKNVVNKTNLISMDQLEELYK